MRDGMFSKRELAGSKIFWATADICHLRHPQYWQAGKLFYTVIAKWSAFDEVYPENVRSISDIVESLLIENNKYTLPNDKYHVCSFQVWLTIGFRLSAVSVVVSDLEVRDEFQNSKGRIVPWYRENAWWIWSRTKTNPAQSFIKSWKNQKEIQSRLNIDDWTHSDQSPMSGFEALRGKTLI